ncbi:MAG: putative large secreted protein, partial [Solirubrobacterales bacterium]|nr:putative large secreted protein [Solirubrobacterales bacterium]
MRRLVLCLLCCGAGLAVSPVAALGEGSSSEASSLPLEGSAASASLDSSLVIPGSPTEAEQLQAQQAAKRLSPEAMAARAASRTKFEGLDSQQAVELAGETFPALIDQPAGGPPTLPAGQSIHSYITADAAQLDLGEGKHGVIESMAPMAIEGPAGGWEPIDLGLRSAGGGFEPKRPIVAVRIPKRLSEGVQLADSGVSVTPVDAQGAALSGSEGMVDGASILYANTQTDTDTVVKPTTAGFAADAVLRSIASPQQLSFRVGLPSGATLVQPHPGEGNVEIVKEGKTVAVVMAPYAHDAVGTAVPVSVTATG